MSILFILIPISLLLVAAAAGAFIWAVDAGQFEDLDKPSWDMLTDEGQDARKLAAMNTPPRE